MQKKKIVTPAVRGLREASRTCFEAGGKGGVMLTPASRSGALDRPPENRGGLWTPMSPKRRQLSRWMRRAEYTQNHYRRAIFISSLTRIAEATQQTCNLDTDKLSNPRFRRSWEKSLLV
jgi:hypothetical protein